MRDVNNAIEVADVRKGFKVYYDRGITLKDKALSRGRSKYELREVLKGISFDVKKGEAIGLIGKNGCGKSTTLKLLTKIIYPNSGTVELSGRVSSLLELGAGFHPDMSGMENIYMNAAVFGLNRKEIDKRVKDIIKFSELEEFIDNPVRTYSSGMYMRLAFSVAINVDADILLIDEILAVGDISFQKKCFEKLKEIKMRGTTIVIVSHSLDQIEKRCDRSIWIEEGLIKEVGKPREIHEHYLQKMEQERLERFQEEYYADMEQTIENDTEEVGEKSEEKEKQLEENTSEISDLEKELPEENVGVDMDEVSQESVEMICAEDEKTLEEVIPPIAAQMELLKMNFLKSSKIVHGGNNKVQFTEMYITNAQGQEKVFFETGEDVTVYLKYDSTEVGLRGTLCLLLYRDDGLYCYGTNTFIEKREVMELREEGTLKVVLERLALLPGKYYFTIAIHDEEAVEYEHLDNVAIIQMFSTKGEQGVVRIDTKWYLE